MEGFSRRVIEYFPNFVTEVDVTKINGSFNTYTIKLVYVIRDGDDPNKVDKILSNAATSRKLIISYGDYNSPTFIYKDEEALIVKVNQSISLESSTITYTITAVSSVKLATEGLYSFQRRVAKPSLVLRDLLKNSRYGLQDIFYGMRNLSLVD